MKKVFILFCFVFCLTMSAQGISVGNNPIGAAAAATVADGSITDAKLGTAAVTREKLDFGAVGTEQLGNLQVTQIKLAQNAVGTAQIEDGRVFRVDLNADVTNSLDLADTAIQAETQTTQTVPTVQQNGVTELNAQLEFEKLNTSISSISAPIALINVPSSRVGLVSDNLRQLINTGAQIEYTFSDAQSLDGATIKFLGAWTFNVESGVSIPNPFQTTTSASQIVYVCNALKEWSRFVDDSQAYVLSPSNSSIYSSADAANTTEVNSVGDWTTNNNTLASVQTVGAQLGSYALRVEATDDTAIYAEAQVILTGLTAAVPYDLTFYAKMDGATGDYNVMFNDITGNPSVTVPQATTSWTEFTLAFTPDAATESLRIQFNDGVANVIGEAIEMDNVRVTPQ